MHNLSFFYIINGNNKITNSTTFSSIDFKPLGLLYLEKKLRRKLLKNETLKEITLE